MRVDETCRYISRQHFLIEIKSKLLRTVVDDNLVSLLVGRPLKNNSRVFIGQHILVSVQFKKGGVSTNKEIVCMILMRAYLLDDSELHRLPAFFNGHLASELMKVDFSFEVAKVIVVVDKEVGKIK